MRSKVLLRIAAIAMLVHSIGYALGLLTWRKSIPAEVAQKMQEVQFSYMYKDGATMANFYTGVYTFGVIFVLFIAVMLWILSEKKDKLAVKLLCIVEAAIILHVVVEVIYLFPGAIILCGLSAVFVLIAVLQIKKTMVP